MSTSEICEPKENGVQAMNSGSFVAANGLYPADIRFFEQIERISNSRELSGSEVLRRLLRFLAEKTVSGEADELKEYTVAIDGLGKPASYDPRHTSAVRIQAGRLRQKLIDYYREEGAHDPIIVTLPKGHFRLSCRYIVPAVDAASDHNEAVQVSRVMPVTEGVVPIAQRSLNWRRFGPFLWIALFSIGLNVYFWVRQPWDAKASDASSTPDLNPALKDLWGPFIASKRPLMLILEDPLFVELHSGDGIYYRDKGGKNSWDVVSNSTGVKKLRAALNNPGIEPSRYYTAFGEAHAAFLIGRLFGNRNQNFFTLAKASEVSSAQLAADNILSVGISTNMFQAQLQGMPIKTEFEFMRDGIRNLHAGPGEPAMYSDQFSTAPSEEGVAYALVSHLPGPLRNTDVESFLGNRSAAYVAAVEAFTDPDFAREITAALRAQSGGQLPRYYQVILKVTFKSSIPTETTCVLAKQLR